MLIRLTVAGSALAISATEGAQDVPTWRLQRDLRIDANQHDLSPIGWITVAPNGTIVLSQSQDTVLRFFDPRGESLGTFGRGGAGPGEFRGMVAHGWIMDTLWVSDPFLRRVTFISPDRKLLRTVMGLSAIRVLGAGRDTGTAFPWIFPQAMFADGSAFVMPMSGRGARTPPWPGAVNDRPQILHVRGDGEFIGVLATKAANPCQVTYLIPGGSGAIGIPYCGAPADHVSSEIRRYASAIVMEQTIAQTRYRVTVIRGPGDTAFSRVYERQSRAIPRRTADSTLAARRRTARFPQEGEANDRTAVPAAYPPYASILVGRDSTTWVAEYVPSPRRTIRRWLVLDERGIPIGRVSVPASVEIIVASRTTVWGTETDDDGLEHVVGYRVSK